MVRSVLYRLEKLESNIRPGKPPMLMTIQFVCPNGKRVINEIVMEVAGWTPKRQKNGQGK
ncbi:MAG: hypothetical protein ABI972_28395 [Acidobacteriota bacterium]